MRIDRCVCADITFAEALEAVRVTGVKPAELGARHGCGITCGMCRPYLRRALRTGQVVFHQILNERDEPETPETALDAPRAIPNRDA